MNELGQLSSPLWLIVGFLVGALASSFLLRCAELESAKKWADLIWIIAGGSGAATAVLLSGYSADFEGARRTAVDLKRSAEVVVDDSGRFLNLYCEKTPDQFTIEVYDDNKDILCGAVRALESSNNPSTLLFEFSILLPELEANHAVCDNTTDSFGEFACIYAGTGLEKDVFFIKRTPFAPQAEIDRALSMVSSWNLTPVLVPEFQLLREKDSQIRERLNELKLELDDIQSTAYKVRIRRISLIVLAFTFPLRILKSLTDFSYIRRFNKTNTLNTTK